MDSAACACEANGWDDLAALIKIAEAARDWVAIYDAPEKTSVAWTNGMQRLRIAIAERDYMHGRR